jgi:hypothetical protein
VLRSRKINRQRKKIIDALTHRPRTGILESIMVGGDRQETFIWLPLIAPTTSDATPRYDSPINLHYSPPFLLFCKHVPMSRAEQSRADMWAPPFALIWSDMFPCLCTAKPHHTRARTRWIGGGNRSNIYRYKFECHSLLYFISDSDTNSDIFRYEYKTDSRIRILIRIFTQFNSNNIF